MRKLKFISDGKTFASKVVDAQTGDIIDGVRAIEIVADPEKSPFVTARLTIEGIAVDAEVEATVPEPIETLNDLQRGGVIKKPTLALI